MTTPASTKFDDVSSEIRDAIRFLARRDWTSEDESTNVLLQTQSATGFDARNRAQTKEDRFGRVRRSEASGVEHMVTARKDSGAGRSD